MLIGTSNGIGRKPAGAATFDFSTSPAGIGLVTSITRSESKIWARNADSHERERAAGLPEQRGGLEATLAARPTIAVRLQELFGLNTHPSIAKGAVPLVLELLSPAQRPVQVTRDLPGFWRGSYAAVRSDLRGRYPRHPWPEDPASAMPTRRVKPRGT